MKKGFLLIFKMEFQASESSHGNTMLRIKDVPTF